MGHEAVTHGFICFGIQVVIKDSVDVPCERVIHPGFIRVIDIDEVVKLFSEPCPCVVIERIDVVLQELWEHLDIVPNQIGSR